MTDRRHLLCNILMAHSIASKPTRGYFLRRYSELYRDRKHSRMRGWSIEARMRDEISAHVRHHNTGIDDFWRSDAFFEPHPEATVSRNVAFNRKTKKLLNTYQLRRYIKENPVCHL